MKAKEFWSKNFARRWTDPPLPTEHQDALSHAYLQGFEKMKSHARCMLTEIGGQNNMRLALLIDAIGNANVDPETGQREDGL